MALSVMGSRVLVASSSCVGVDQDVVNGSIPGIISVSTATTDVLHSLLTVTIYRPPSEGISVCRVGVDSLCERIPSPTSNLEASLQHLASPLRHYASRQLRAPHYPRVP